MNSLVNCGISSYSNGINNIKSCNNLNLSINFEKTHSHSLLSYKITQNRLIDAVFKGFSKEIAKSDSEKRKNYTLYVKNERENKKRRFPFSNNKSVITTLGNLGFLVFFSIFHAENATHARQLTFIGYNIDALWPSELTIINYFQPLIDTHARIKLTCKVVDINYHIINRSQSWSK